MNRFIHHHNPMTADAFDAFYTVAEAEGIPQVRRTKLFTHLCRLARQAEVEGKITTFEYLIAGLANLGFELTFAELAIVVDHLTKLTNPTNTNQEA